MIRCAPAVLVACLLAACGTKPKPKTAASTLSVAEVEAKRAACAYGPGMLVKDTVPSGNPVGKDIPIEHIILLMQENRSFDHYFGELQNDNPEVDGAPRTIVNPDSHGNLIERFHQSAKCGFTADHGWDAEHSNYNGGQLDGFVKTNGDSRDPMGYYDATELPFYYALAKSFAISDRHFSSALAPTWPNRMFFMAGTSFGRTDNVGPDTTDAQGKPYPNMFTEMDAAKVSWRVYFQDVPTPLILPYTLDKDAQNGRPEEQFVTDVASGDLAQVTMVETTDLHGSDDPDEGPPGDVNLGQQFTSGVIQAIMHSPFWKNTAIFLTYDENGGMYDHVRPPIGGPAACAPDDIPPNNGGTVGFNQLGFRVPFIVISPYAKRGHVSHVVEDHTAILRFLEARFDMPSMTRRDANTEPPYDMFDFDHPDFSIPDLPTPVVDEMALKACGG